MKAIMLAKKLLKHICILNPQGYVQNPPPLGKTDTGGQITYILNLAKVLGESNIKVDIITRQFTNQVQEEEIFNNVKIVRIPCGSNEFIPKEKIYELTEEMTENILEYLNKQQKNYDLIHSHYWDGGYVGLSMAKILDIPHIHTPHSLGKWKEFEMSVEETPASKLKPLYRYQVRIAAEQKIMNRVEALILQAESLRIKILQHYMVDFEKLHVIFPGIDTKFFNQRPTVFDKQVKLKRNSILTVGRMVPNKGLDRLLDSLNLIKNKVNFNLYMAGGGKSEYPSEEEAMYWKKIKTLIKKYHLEKRVDILGHIDEKLLPAFYRKADVLAFPSRYEPFGMVPLEAMACGVTCIVSNVAGCREVIIDGLNGFVVDPHNRAQLADSIYTVLSNEKLREKLASNAAFTVKKHYSWNEIVNKFIELYQKIVFSGKK